MGLHSWSKVVTDWSATQDKMWIRIEYNSANGDHVVAADSKNGIWKQIGGKDQNDIYHYIGIFDNQVSFKWKSGDNLRIRLYDDDSGGLAEDGCFFDYNGSGWDLLYDLAQKTGRNPSDFGLWHPRPEVIRVDKIDVNRPRQTIKTIDLENDVIKTIEDSMKDRAPDINKMLGGGSP